MSLVPGSSGSEGAAADLWIETVLSGSTELNAASPSGLGLNQRIYNGMGPVDTMFPFVVYNWLSGTDEYAFGQPINRLISEMSYGIFIITAAADMSRVKPMLDLIDRLMNVAEANVSQTLSDGSVYDCIFSSRREKPISFPENHGGETVWHKGGQYRVSVQALMTTAPS